MANNDSSSPSVPVTAPLASKKENLTLVSSKIAELNDSRLELLNKIVGLKQDLQGWRSKLDTQVKVYHNELEELKKSLNSEVEQLRTEFQDLRTTLEQQQEDVTTNLRHLGLRDVSGDAPEAQNLTAESKDKEAHVSTKEDSNEANVLTKEDTGKETEV